MRLCVEDLDEPGKKGEHFGAGMKCSRCGMGRQENSSYSGATAQGQYKQSLET